MSERIYIAGPFSTERERESLNKMISLIRGNFPNSKLYIPMEFKVPGESQKPDGSWNLENYDWARQVYLNDLKHIEEATKVFAMYTGRNATTGTAWD
jgi:nucleoside 2-deoxyribosyltransferase